MGSVKSNIGHLETAAGAAGMIKVLLMMKYGRIPPSLHFDRPNPNIDFEDLHIDIPKQLQNWEESYGGFRVAGVNSFGFGGTNGHAVVVNPLQHKYSETNCSIPHCVVVFTGKTKQALGNSISDVLHNFEQCLSLQNLSLTSLLHRDHYACRKAVCATSLQDLKQELAQLDDSGYVDCEPVSSKPTQMVWLFTGMGTHWAGMGDEMVKLSLFQQKLEEVDSVLMGLGCLSVMKAMRNKVDLSDPSIGQPVLFAYAVSLAHQWLSWGVKPDVVIGHSVGEIAAAYIAGHLTLHEACGIVYHRGKLLARVTGGKMLAVGNVEVQDLETTLKQFKGVNIAAHNSAKSFTLSGDSNAITAVKSKLPETAFVRELNVQVAYHSHHMDSICEEFRNELSSVLEGSCPEEGVDQYSTVYGKKLSCSEFHDPEYWVANVRRAVQFEPSLKSALDMESHNVVLEIGPKAALKRYVQEIAKEEDVDFSWFSSVAPHKEISCVLNSLGAMFEAGVPISWEKFMDNMGMAKERFDPTIFPRYAFERKRLHYEPQVSRAILDGRSRDDSSHQFVKPIDPAKGHYVVHVSPGTTPFIFEHKFEDVILAPGATHVEIALSSFIHMTGFKIPIQLVSVSAKFESPLTVKSDTSDFQVDVFLKEAEKPLNRIMDHKYLYQVKNSNKVCASGTVMTRSSFPSVPKLDIALLRSRCDCTIGQREFYDKLAKFGFSYGPCLTHVHSVSSNSTECVADIETPPEICEEMNNTSIHPAFVDQAFQLLSIFSTLSSNPDDRTMPVYVDKVTVFSRMSHRMHIYMKQVKQEKDSCICNAAITSTEGTVLATLTGITVEVLKQTDGRPQTVESCIPRLETFTLKPSSLQFPGKILTLAHQDDPVAKYLSIQFGSRQKVKDLQMYLPICERDDYRAVLDFMSELKDNDNIVLVMPHSSNLHLTNCTGEDLFQRVKAPLAGLRHALQLLESNDVSVSLVTVNAGDSLVLRPLISFLRCFLMERPRQSVRSIDLKSLTVENLAALQTALVSQEKEITIDQGTFHRWGVNTQDRQLQYTATKKASQKDMMNSDLVLTSRSPHDYTRVAWQYESKTGTETGVNMKQKTVLVRVKNVHLHDPDMFAITKDQEDCGKTLIWPAHCSSGHKLIGYDFEGELVTKKQRTDVICCYPLPVSREVIVPKNCIIRKSESPVTKPCWSWLVAAWTCLRGVKAGAQIGFNTSEDNHGCGALQRILTVLILKMGCVLHNLDSVADMCMSSVDLSIILPGSLIPRSAFRQIVSASRQVKVVVGETMNSSIGSLLANCHPNVACLKLCNVVSECCKSKGLKPVLRWCKRLNLTDEDFSGVIEQFMSIQDVPGNVYRPEFEWGCEASTSTGCKLPGGPSLPLLTLAADSTTHALSVTPETLFRKSGIYIVVGGTKGLGLVMVEYLARKGAGHICSIARAPPSPEVFEKARTLQLAHGTKITFSQCDVSDLLRLTNILELIQANSEGMTVKGVFFGAAIVDDALVYELTEKRVEKVIKPKIVGAWNFHQLLKNADLDFFVLHSSLTSVIGNVGQANYAAGNGFLDALAFYRRTLNLAAQTINWGPLDFGIFKNSQGAEEWLGAFGFRVLSTESTCELLEVTLMRNPTQVVHMNLDWTVLNKYVAEHFPHMAAIFEIDTSLYATQISSQHSQIQQLVQKITLQLDVETSVQQYLKAIFASAGSPVDGIENDVLSVTALSDLGIHSLALLEIASLIKEHFGIQIQFTTLLGLQMGQLQDMITENYMPLNNVSTNTLNATHLSAGVESQEDLSGREDIPSENSTMKPDGTEGRTTTVNHGDKHVGTVAEGVLFRRKLLVTTQAHRVRVEQSSSREATLVWERKGPDPRPRMLTVSKHTRVKLKHQKDTYVLRVYGEQTTVEFRSTDGHQMSNIASTISYFASHSQK